MPASTAAIKSRGSAIRPGWTNCCAVCPPKPGRGSFSNQRRASCIEPNRAWTVVKCLPSRPYFFPLKGEYRHGGGRCGNNQHSARTSHLSRLIDRLATTGGIIIVKSGHTPADFDRMGSDEIKSLFRSQSLNCSPAAAFAVAVTAVQLGGSALIIVNRLAWLGAAMLGVFLALTIPIAHPFWAMPEPQRTISFFTTLEHISLIGGLMVAAALAVRSSSLAHKPYSSGDCLSKT